MATTVKKNKTATVASQKGSYQYSYSDLAAVNTALEGMGYSYDQYIETFTIGEESHDYIMTQRYKKDPEGNLSEWGAPKRGLRLDYVQGETPQQIGSRVTYLRRYSVLMAFGFAAEDDDGAGASDKPPKNQPHPKNNNPPAPKVDFALVRETLKQLDSVEDIEEYWRSLKLRESQAKFLIKDFAKRKEEINGME